MSATGAYVPGGRYALTASVLGKIWDPLPGLPGLFTSEGQDGMSATLHDYRDWREQQQSFSGMGAFFTGTVNVSGTDRPERFIGIHFMNPVPVMKLVELVRGIATENSTFETAKDFVRAVEAGAEVVRAIEGTDYGSTVWPVSSSQGRHPGFREPRYAWALRHINRGEVATAHWQRRVVRSRRPLRSNLRRLRHMTNL